MKTATKISHLQLSFLISISLFLITLSFKSYFYFRPFELGFNLLSMLQFLTIIGWISIIALPPLYFASEYKWSTSKYYSFLGLTTLWTTSTVLIKVYTLINLGQVWAGYLATYPVMIYFEWIIPIVYVTIVIKNYKPTGQNRPTRERRYREDERFERSVRERLED